MHEQAALAAYGVAALAVDLGLSEEQLRTVLAKRGRLDAEAKRVMRARAACMVGLREAGLTLDKIAIEWGVTRERVRMIVVEEGGPSAAEIHALRRQREEQSLKSDREVVAALLAERPGTTLNEIVEQTGWTEGRVEQALTRSMKSMLTRGRTVTSRWSREEIVGILQAAAEIEGVRGTDVPLTGAMYDAVRDDLQGPSRPKISQVFGSWSAALAEAGLAAGDGPPRRSRFTDEDLWTSVISYLLDPESGAHSFDGYDEWRSVHAPAAASGSFIRNRLGRWSDVRAEGYKRAADAGVLNANILRGEAVAASGRELSEHEFGMTEETLQRVQLSGGNPGNPVDYDRHALEGSPTSQALIEAFGSWGLALGALGWDPDEFRSRPLRMSDEEALGQLRDYALTFLESTGLPPTAADWETDRSKTVTVGPWSYSRRYGGWREALLAAGVPEEQAPLRLGTRRAAIALAPLAEALRESGGSMTMDGWDAQRGSAPSAALYRREFGSWAAVLRAAEDFSANLGEPATGGAGNACSPAQRGRGVG